MLRKDPCMAHVRITRQAPSHPNLATLFCLRLIIAAASAGITSLLSDTPIQAGSLFQCRDASGALTYTDSTAQLGNCVPVQSLPPAQMGHTPTPPTYTPHTEPQPSSGPSMAVQPEQFPGQTLTMTSPDHDAMGIPPDTGTAIAPPIPGTRLCDPGLNPVNPLSAQPCPAPLPPDQATQRSVFLQTIPTSNP